MSQPVTAHRSSLTEYLGQQLLDFIRSQGLGPGDRLPSVSQLAEQFAVAPPTLREALRRLEATGAVQIRHGSGIYVRESLERLVMVNPNAGLSQQKILDLLDARLLIEPHLAGLAAARVTPAELDELAGLLEQAKANLEGNDSALHRANGSFHAAIARCSGNSVLSSVVQSLMELYSYEQLVILEVYNARSRDHDDHQIIFRALQERNREGAESLMRQHILEVRMVMQRRLDGGES